MAAWKKIARKKRKGARTMVHGGRRMQGYVWVEAQAKDLEPWVTLPRSYVATLPPKKR